VRNSHGRPSGNQDAIHGAMDQFPSVVFRVMAFATTVCPTWRPNRRDFALLSVAILPLSCKEMQAVGSHSLTTVGPQVTVRRFT
jgi:hypothetical protein